MTTVESIAASKSWKELAEHVTLEAVKALFAKQERQRLGDKRRNLARAAIIEHVNGNEQLRKQILQRAGLA